MTMGRMTVFVALLTAMSVVGCQTTDDPRAGGFISGITALNSGAYENRIRQREATVDELDAVRASLETRLDANERDMNRTKTERLSLERRLSSLERASADTRTKLEIASRQRKLDEKKLASLLSEQQSIERTLIAVLQQRRARDKAVSSQVAEMPGNRPDESARTARDLEERQWRLQSVIRDTLGE